MFGRFFQDFQEDPFFSENPPKLHGEYPVERILKHESNKERKTKNGDQFHSIFSGMDFMSDMMNQMQRAKDDPNSYCFSSSSVMSYQSDGKSQPKIYQASTATKKAPGQIKETRRTLRDSEAGLEKMAIGQYLGEKGRVVERRRQRGGSLNEEKQYLQMDEGDEKNFEKEWKEKTGGITIPSFARTGIGSGPIHNTKAKPRKIQNSNSGAVRPHGPSHSGRNKHRL